MKKIIFGALLMSIMLFTSCNGSKDEGKQEEVPINVEQLTQADKQAMTEKGGTDFVWFETIIKLKDYIDTDDTFTPQEMTNVFALIDTVKNEEIVYEFKHDIYGQCTVDSTYDVWIEDCVLQDSLIKLNYEQACERVRETDMIKPHSTNAILRNPLGPLQCNPQWVFGNVKEQIWIDATTGDAKDANPAFPQDN